MKIVFKSEEFAELNFVRNYEEGFSVAEKSGISESVYEVDYMGIRSRNHKIYCPGIICSLAEGSLEKDLVQILESDFPYLQMHFELSTTGCLYQPQAKAEVETVIYKGMHSLLFYPSLKGKLYYLKKANSFSVEIELSLDFIRRIFHGDLEVLGEFGRNIERNLPSIMGGKSYPITPAMKQIILEIRNCSYAGSLKKIFVEAKVTELLALQISQINMFETSTTTLRQSDIDRLHHVKDLLQKDLNSHYSIEELARIAGINRTKLQQGFKKLFGTTIFGCISDNRLAEARRLIINGQYTTLAEVSGIAGYKNPQHFTAAFKKKYGHLPKETKGA
ncbi:helix-turn-helix domain-containing protein [Dyadobacter diqingensis]|uniref:helix-turn-helix domain-containing protein n=1 Tax=Dyadobacter diqingensis TaxID=2938121 RepID=UPI0020C191AE|nr:AraC family transcriptional regulator [Dyadobacter diqingensis]